MKPARRNWVVVDFGYSVLEPMARVLSQLGRLRLYAVAALRKPVWDRGETVLLRSIMGLNIVGGRFASLRGREIVLVDLGVTHSRRVRLTTRPLAQEVEQVSIGLLTG